MSLNTLNPYPSYGDQFKSGLNAIIAALPGAPTIADLVAKVEAYVEPIYYPAGATTAQKMELKSIVYSAINSYVNGQVKSMYSGSSKGFVDMLIGPSLQSNLPVDAIKNRILDIEDNLSESNLSVETQTPLLLATQVGVVAYDYWLGEIALGAGSAWITYLTAAKVSAMGNVPFWTASAMEGSLIGTRSTNRGMIETTTQIVTTEIIASLTAALTIAVGKVIFLWIPRLQRNGGLPGGCGCSK